MAEHKEEAPASPTKAAPEDVRLPEGVIIPDSIESSRSTLFTGDVVDMLKQLPIDKINAAFDTFNYQVNLQGDEIRNRRAYLRGILKGHLGGRSEHTTLPRGVNVPATLDPKLLDDIKDVLKNMSVRDINSCFRDYDKQMKKNSGQIRNKSAYLLGIIKSGPHYNLPQGVVIPSTLSLAMLQGELLETMQQLPAAHINVALSEYDEQVQKKGDTIRSKQGYLLGIMKRVKKDYEEETAELGGNNNSHQASPTKEGPGQAPYSPSKSNNTNGTAAKMDNNTASSPEIVGNPEQAQGTLNLVTESFVKVTNELVIERQARNDLQDQMRQEQNRREETNQRILKLMSDLANEKEQRERSALEVERLKKDLAFERSLRENAEEKVQVLEDSRVAQQNNNDGSPGTEHEQLQKLELELSIERGLREKTEKLLQTAEIRINDLNRELKYVQDRLHEERAKSPFGTWMASSPLGDVGSEDKKTSDYPPNLSGITELVSMTEFDPETFTFSNKKDSHQNGSGDPLHKVYRKDEILVTAGEVVRFLQLNVGGENSEKVQVNVRVQIPGGSAPLNVNAVIITNSTNGENARKDVEAALPDLIEACRAEATNGNGKDTVLSVLTAADYWASNNWPEIQIKNNGSTEKKLEMCRMLLQSKAINDQTTLKHLVTKFGFGGFVKLGEPGLLLLEGLQKNSNACVESLSGFAVVGKSTEMVDKLSSSSLLPTQLTPVDTENNGGAERLQTVCNQVGLAASLAKVMEA